MKYYKQLNLEIKIAEETINSLQWYQKEKQEWWKWYRHALLESLLSYQLRTFNRDT